MYKIVVLDDEINICNLIENLIDYDRWNIQLERKFTESTECLEYLKSNDVDIVISDIQMYCMTGLELLEKIREVNKKIHFIMISGYNYFDFARQAIQFGADNYLLKPINRKELNDALAAVIQKIDAETAQMNEISEAREHIESQAQELLARDFFNGSLFRQSKEKISREYRIEFPFDLFAVGILHVDVATTKYYTDTLLIHKLHGKIADVLEKLEVWKSILVHNNRNLYFLVNFPMEKKAGLQSELRLYLAKQQDILGGEKQILLTVGLSNAYRWKDGIEAAVMEATAGVKSRLFIPPKRVITAAGIGYSDDNEKDSLADIQTEVRKYVETVNQDALYDYVKACFMEATREDVPVYARMDRVKQIAGVVLSEIRNTFTTTASWNLDSLDGIEGNFCSFREYHSYFLECMRSMMDSMIIDSDKMDKWAVAQVKRFIQDHYGSRLSLEILAKEVNLSPVYLGTLFKNSSGITITEYITGIRMDKAKELLKNTTQNINEIAEQVGFSDAKYFAKLFKKEIGVKPTEYRDIQSRLSRRK